MRRAFPATLLAAAAGLPMLASASPAPDPDVAVTDDGNYTRHDGGQVALPPSGGHLVREDVHHGKSASGVHS